MILIGQYDSPFVRRVGIALRRYELPFEHRPWSVWSHAEQIAQYNPLRRVPTLLLDDGSVLVESFSILSALDDLVGEARALWPVRGPARLDALRVAALATGFADKAVVLLYSTLDLMKPSEAFKARCQTQIRETLAVLEKDRAARSTDYWLGGTLTHADIAFACAFRFTREAHPALIDARHFPSLTAQADRCEALPEFREIFQPITNPL
jgi:glutathione S-transferase